MLAEARDAAKDPATLMAASSPTHNRELSVQNVNRTKTEKLAVECRGIDEIITQMKFYLLTEIRAIMMNTG